MRRRLNMPCGPHARNTRRPGLISPLGLVVIFAGCTAALPRLEPQGLPGLGIVGDRAGWSGDRPSGTDEPASVDDTPFEVGGAAAGETSTRSPNSNRASTGSPTPARNYRVGDWTLTASYGSSTEPDATVISAVANYYMYSEVSIGPLVQYGIQDAAAILDVPLSNAVVGTTP